MKATSEFGIVEAKFVGALGISGGELPAPTFAEIAFAGRSNVGKSSLINALVERRGLVRASSTPGMTRQINLFETRARDGTHLVLADLPGYGFAKRSKQERKAWAGLIESYLRTRPTLGVVTLIIDARRGIAQEEEDLIAFAKQPRPGMRSLQVVIVATKIDKLARSQQHSLLSKMQASARLRVIPFSAVSGEGRGPLWHALRSALGLLSQEAQIGSNHGGNPAENGEKVPTDGPVVEDFPAATKSA